MNKMAQCALWAVISIAVILVVLIAFPVISAVPDFFKPWPGNATNACINHLKEIDVAKEQWALEHHRVIGAPVIWNDLVPEYSKHILTCPGNGTYTLGSIGTEPTCTVPGHKLP